MSHLSGREKAHLWLPDAVAGFGGAGWGGQGLQRGGQGEVMGDILISPKKIFFVFFKNGKV